MSTSIFENTRSLVFFLLFALVAPNSQAGELCGTLALVSEPPSHKDTVTTVTTTGESFDIGTEVMTSPIPRPENLVVRPIPTPDPDYPPLRIQAALAWQDTYHPGDALELDVVLGIPGAQVAVDFSAIDSDYRAGDESVEDMGDGHYRVFHVISRLSQRPSGSYSLPIASATSQVSEMGTGSVRVDYLSSARRNRLEVTGARSILGPTPAHEPGGVKITSVKKLKSAGTRTHRLQIEIEAPLTARDFELEFWQPEIDAHWQLPVVINSPVCDATACRHTTEVEVSRRDAANTATSGEIFNLEFQAVVDGSASNPYALNNLWFQAPEFDPTHRVSGLVFFQYQHRQADTANSQGRADWPQYANVTSTIEQEPVRWANVVLRDECGNYIKQTTDGNGFYNFGWRPVACDLVEIEIWAYVENGPRKAAVGFWKHGAVDSYEDLTAHTPDYLAHSYSFSFDIADAELATHASGKSFHVTVPSDTPEARAFFILDNVVTSQDYYRDIAGVSGLPKLNVIYSPGLKPVDAPNDWDGGYAVYMPSKDPGMIVIPAEPDFGWNSFAHRHETSHYFQEHYLRPFTYGKIGEPLANVQAAAIAGNEWFDKIESFESLDAQPNYKDGAFRGASWSLCNGCEDLDYSYGWTQRVLWDLIDSTSNVEPEPITSWIPDGGNFAQPFGLFDADFGGGGHNKSVDADDHELNDVLMNYLGGGIDGTQSQHYQDRGLVKLDIVDVIDGMLCRGKITEGAVETLLNFTMGFGYDFGGPNSCN